MRSLFPYSELEVLSPSATFTDNCGGGTCSIADSPGPAGTPGPILDRPLVVSGLSGTVNSVSITITNFTSTCTQDIDFLLVAPDGGTKNLEFWSDAGNCSTLVGGPITITVAVSGAAPLLSGTQLQNGTTYRPADYQQNEANTYYGSLGLTIQHPTTNGAATFSSAFDGIAGNGTWHLYAADDEAGDLASFTGWTLNVATTGGNQPPVINNLNLDALAFTEGGAAGHLDSGTAATVTDADSANFNGGNLTASITINKFATEDVLGFDTSGAVTLSSGTNVGSTVSVSGTAVGTIAAAGTGANGNDLVVTLNTNATPGRVTTLVQNLTYLNSNSVNPNINQRTIVVTANDGSGASGTSTPVNVFVTVAATGDEGMTTFTNSTGTGTIPDNGAAVVQTVNVSGLVGNVTDVRMTITGLTHAFASDLDFLLVAPDNTSNLEFWSDASGNGPVNNVNVLIADFGASNLPNSAPVSGTTYRAADYSVVEANNYFGPTFTIKHPQTNGIGVFSSSFKGIAPNGNWTLYVKDGQASDTGGFTAWSIAIATDAGAPVNGPPIISNLNGDNPTFTEGDVAAIALDSGGNATVTDADSPDFNTGNLTASITNERAEDALLISTTGTITLSNGHLTGSIVSVSGTPIGTLAAGGNGANGNPLIVTFNANATPATVTTLVRALTYYNRNKINPNINPRVVPVTIDDGDGATSLAAVVTVNVVATGDEPMTTFSNNTGLTIPDAPAAAVSQTITVSGLSGSVQDVRVTLTGLTHAFPQDLNFLLVGPDGGARNLEFWGNAAGQNPGLAGATISIADFGAPTLPGGTNPVSGTTYRAAEYAAADPNTYFGPTFPINHATTIGTATFASAFVGATANGTWTLYARDGSSTDAGSITGWSLSIASFVPTASAVGVSGRVVDPSGAGLRNARVVFDDGTGHPVAALTNAFGYYYTQVQSGSSYVLTASARGYVFTPRVVTVSDAMTDIDLVALP